MNTAFDNTLIQWIDQHWRPSRPLCLGICGAQGSGKSTLAKHLASHFEQQGRTVAVLSIDDLYLSRNARLELAETVHPLLKTRGVPGTHDVAGGLTLLRQLKHLDQGQSVVLPRFNKAADDPEPQSHWPYITGPVDLILFEGWCIGLPAQEPAELAEPINNLEHSEDADARWRTWVNQALAGDYQSLWAQLDKLIFLQIPDWSCVLGWRSQQEKDNALKGGQHVMGVAELERFVQHYERLSRHALRCMPARADVLRQLGDQHQVLRQDIRA